MVLSRGRFFNSYPACKTRTRERSQRQLRFNEGVRLMKHLSPAGSSIVLLFVLHVVSIAQTAARQSSAEPPVLYLHGGNNAQQVNAQVGQTIQITLQTIGPGQYGSPTISSTVIQFEGAAFAKMQNPGGPKQVYRFRARAQGEARIDIPHVVQVLSDNASELRDSNPAFALTIRVAPRH